MKRSLPLYLLIGVNALLLCVLVGMAIPPRPAMAQAIGGAGNYLMVTGNIQSDYDAIYIIDLAQRQLYTFTVKRGQAAFEFRGVRDLQQDFRP
jgi:hypothetical protein